MSLISKATAKKSNYNMVGANYQRRIAKAYPVARRGLPGDGDIWIFDLKVIFESDSAGDVENHGPRPFGVNRFPQRARAGVGQSCYVKYLSAPSAFSVGPETFGPVKGRDRSRFGCCR